NEENLQIAKKEAQLAHEDMDKLLTSGDFTHESIGFDVWSLLELVCNIPSEKKNNLYCIQLNILFL
ncbi:hypothetical protein SK128_017680, partial [Halocaridina rubra]